jgi:hypothetical protein
MSRSKAKGTAFETAVCRYLAGEGFPHVERRALSGTQDRGDIAGIPGWVLEVKNCRATTLAAWVDEAAVEQANDGAEYSAVWHHRVGRAHPSAGYVTMSGATFVRLLRQAGYGEPLRAPDPRPDCPGEFHGADGGRCALCGWDARPPLPELPPGPPQGPEPVPDGVSGGSLGSRAVRDGVPGGWDWAREAS